ncbi:hypothetical protein [Gallibacterium sp. AGMB14963]|uniref:hypothetical protein n=1 Tax=Gallibacterium faecale TaxID=3019086 RepID=UPI0022F1BCA8|nr:hypothetical protein [Gallibacterium sp. AGMB14963]MDA3977592.1 hypothetical protein [Gallibacterium sp. AGMB14963]
MQQVIDPVKNRLITVEEYIKEYAKNSLDNLDYTAPLMICPHCLNNRMKLKARSSINVSPYFVHPKNNEYCPSKILQEGIYLNCKITDPDVENANKLKKHFREHWKYYFQKIRNMVPYLRKEEFTKIIDISLRERIWEYKNVQSYHLPYLFVTLADFSIQHPNSYYKEDFCRSLHFRYWFQSKLDNYKDLINNINVLSLCRASYKLTEKQTQPRQDQLQKIQSFEIINDLMEQDTDKVSIHIEKWIEKYFEIKNWQH